MNIRWAAVAAILLVAAGCASTSKVMLGHARAPIDPALVQIYSTPPAGSQEIAQLESASAVGFGTQGQTAAAAYCHCRGCHPHRASVLPCEPWPGCWRRFRVARR